MKLYAVTVLLARHFRGASGYVEKMQHALGLQCFAKDKLGAARKIEEAVADLPEAKGFDIENMVFVEISPESVLKYAQYLKGKENGNG